jgi:hypothetical protein
MKKLRWFFLAISVEGFGCLVYLLAIPIDPKNIRLFGLSPVRLSLALALILAILFSLFMIWDLRKQSKRPSVIYEISGRIYFHYRRLLFVGCLSITVIIICVGFILYWYFFGQGYHAIMLRLSPIVLFVTLANTTFLFTVNTRFHQAWLSSELFQSIRGNFSKYKVKEIMMVVMLMVMGIFYYDLATAHAEKINIKSDTNDQSAFMNFSVKVWESNFRYMGGRNRMPVYAFLQAAFYRPKFNDKEFFIHAKQVNILLSLLLLTITFIILRRYLSVLPAVNLILIFAFGLYVFKAGYVQVELLFYFLIFVSTILLIRMLISPSISLGIMTGIWLGITQLAKAAMLPLLAFFIFTFLSKEFTHWLQKKQTNELDRNHNRLIYRLSGLLLVILCFLIVVYPYISESKRIYGQYFYNVNSTFYIWYDSWDEVKQGTRAFGDRDGWPDMPEDQIPTFRKYMREHSLDQVYKRFTRGLKNQLNNIINPYSFFNYTLIYFSILIVFGLINYKSSAKLIKKFFWPVIFILSILIGYLLSYAWFTPIAKTTYRFTYTWFLPFLFWVSIAVHKLVSESPEIKLFGKVTRSREFIKLLDISILGLIIFDIVQYIPNIIMSSDFGK